MKTKKLLGLLAGLTAFTLLFACGCKITIITDPTSENPTSENPTSENPTNENPTVEPIGDDGTLTPEEKLVLDVRNGNTDLDSMSVEQLLAYIDALQDEDNAVLQQNAEYDLMNGDREIDGFDADAERDFDFAADAKVTTVTDTAWKDGTFEALDLTEGMSPEEKAEYEAMMAELENFDAEAFQAEMDEMLSGFEGLDPEDPDVSDPRNPDDEIDDTPTFYTEWPQIPITAGIPALPFDDIQAYSTPLNLTIMKSGVTMDEVKAYVQQLKNAGFTHDANEFETVMAGMVVYSYSASDNTRTLQVAVSNGTLTFVIAWGAQ